MTFREGFVICLVLCWLVAQQKGHFDSSKAAPLVAGKFTAIAPGEVLWLNTGCFAKGGDVVEQMNGGHKRQNPSEKCQAHDKGEGRLESSVISKTQL